MKNKEISYGVTIALLIFLLFLFWDSYSPTSQEGKSSPQTLGQCGIEDCHGLNITCGANVPEVCDSSYAAGDNCRQYASCKIVDNKCRLIKTQKFNLCKSCVEKCYEMVDTIEFFECESKCVE